MDLNLRPERSFTGVSGPSGPESAKKVSKRVFVGVCKKSPKIPETEKKNPKIGFWGAFLTRVFCVLALSGPETPDLNRKEHGYQRPWSRYAGGYSRSQEFRPIFPLFFCFLAAPGLGCTHKGCTTTHASGKGCREGFPEWFLKGGLLWVVQ